MDFESSNRNLRALKSRTGINPRFSFSSLLQTMRANVMERRQRNEYRVFFLPIQLPWVLTFGQTTTAYGDAKAWNIISTSINKSDSRRFGVRLILQRFSSHNQFQSLIRRTEFIRYNLPDLSNLTTCPIFTPCIRSVIIYRAHNPSRMTK